MQRAIVAAQAAVKTDDVPIGAAIFTPDGELVSTGVNATRESADPTRHAEMVAIADAVDALSTTGWELSDCTLVVTIEPRSEEHTSELQSRGHLVCRPLLEKK